MIQQLLLASLCISLSVAARTRSDLQAVLALQLLHSAKRRHRRGSVRRLRPRLCDIIKDMRPSHFTRTFRMPLASFEKLLSLVANKTKKNQRKAFASSGGPVLPRARISMTLRYLAGGSQLDSATLYNFEISTVQKVVHETIEALNKVLKLDAC